MRFFVSVEILDALVLEGLKPHPLTSFDGKSDPQEHITILNTQMVIVGATDSLEHLKMPLYKVVHEFIEIIYN